MSHASHQEHEQARRHQRHAELADRPLPDNAQPVQRHDPGTKGTAPAAPPQHEDEAFKVIDGSAAQSDG